MKILEAHKKITNIANSIEDIPYKVWTCFWSEKPQINIESDYFLLEGDCKNLKEMRDGIEWFVEQFGGTVKWEK